MIPLCQRPELETIGDTGTDKTAPAVDLMVGIDLGLDGADSGLRRSVVGCQTVGLASA